MTNNDKPDLPKRLDGLLGQPRVDGIDAFVREHPGDVKTLIEQFGRESEPTAVAALVRHIKEQAGAKAIPELEPYLKHSRPAVVANAVSAMAEIDAEAARPLVLPWLLAEDQRVRANVLLVLAPTWKTEVIEFLARMASSPRMKSRASAVWCLTQLEDAEVNEVLAARLGEEQDAAVLEEIARAFRKVRGPETIELLARTAHDFPERKETALGLIDAIGKRCRVPAVEVAQTIEREFRAGPGGALARKHRREQLAKEALALAQRAEAAGRARGMISGAISVPRQTGKQTPLPPPVGKARRLAVAGALAAVLVVGGAVWGLQEPAAGDGSPGAVASARPVRPAGTGASARPAAPGGPVKLAGPVAGVFGSTVIVRQDQTCYAIRFPPDGVPPNLTKGQHVQLVARYVGYNRNQGYVLLDGGSAGVVQ